MMMIDMSLLSLLLLLLRLVGRRHLLLLLLLLPDRQQETRSRWNPMHRRIRQAGLLLMLMPMLAHASHEISRAFELDEHGCIGWGCEYVLLTSSPGMGSNA